MCAVILTEAGNNFGLGHLSRCQALSEYLQLEGFEVIIYNRGDWVDSSCVSYNWLEDDIDSIISDNVVVVDSYYASYVLCENITKKAKVCVFFDDFNRMAYPKDSILLNGALGAQKYYSNLQNEAYIGIEYGLLKKEFRQKEPKKINKDISRVLIALGEHDVCNYTQQVLEIVERECGYAHIDVVLGKYHRPLSYGFDTNVHENLDSKELKNLMLLSDLAISGGVTTMLELQSTLTPTIALEITPNQAHELRAWQMQGLRVAHNIHQIKSLLKTLKKNQRQKKAL